MSNAIGRKHGREKIIAHIEADLKEVRENKTNAGTAETQTVIIQDSVIIQGDNKAPVNLKGNQANDDSVQNRATVNPTEKTGDEDEN